MWVRDKVGEGKCSTTGEKGTRWTSSWKKCLKTCRARLDAWHKKDNFGMSTRPKDRGMRERIRVQGHGRYAFGARKKGKAAVKLPSTGKEGQTKITNSKALPRATKESVGGGTVLSETLGLGELN